MTIPNQISNENTDPRRPSVSTSSLPLVGNGSNSNYGHQRHRLPNITHQPTYHATASPPPSLVPPPPPGLQYPSSNMPFSAYAAGGRTPPPIISRTATPPSATAGLTTHIVGGPSSPPPPPSLLMRSSYMDQQYHSTTQQHSTVVDTYNSAASPPMNNSSTSRPLNVTDALGYLDNVKNKFKDQPTIYNRFLDIMKDFKSQVIDTPGVIDRVSTLFKGHPGLISGFNTFLPPGYRIECFTHDTNRIIVTTPNGAISTTTTDGLTDKSAAIVASSNSVVQQQPYYYPTKRRSPNLQQLEQFPSLHPPPPSASFTTNKGGYNHKLPQMTTSSSSPIMKQERQQQVPPAATIRSVSPSLQQTTTPNERPTVEFNYAINYVNRIKNRFVDRPEVYKQFLEILQTYQKEQKPIPEVYAQVKYLFRNGAEDLIDGFQQFLPLQEAAVAAAAPSSFFGSVGQKRPLTSSSQEVAPPQKKKKVYQSRKPKMELQQPQDEAERIYMMEKEIPLFDPSKPSVSAEETYLFDRIRIHIDSDPSYKEFLKALTLYTQQVFDMDELIDHIKLFFTGDAELFEDFKKIIGHEPKTHPIERPAMIAQKPDLQLCPRASPSYRLVPKDWQIQPCSGRDQLCWEVLNDAYASHPTWASEDTGFVASKKNLSEEALHKTEEERYEYDLNIEANLNTIALLEPIALQIQQMTPEQQANLRLKPGLGGPTVSIYERIIKKVYDHDRGADIIDMLYRRPAAVIPVLLKRLKMKDTEWKKAQRDWNKIWRDVDDKNFYKALDYQYITFKANDKKAITNRVLITEMESKVEVFSYMDHEVFKDVERLALSCIKHPSWSNGFVKGDQKKIRGFLDVFVPTFFHVAMNSKEDGTTEEESPEREDASPHQEKNSNKLVVSASNVVKVEQQDEALLADEVVTVVSPKATGNVLGALNLFGSSLSSAASAKKKSISIFYCHSTYLCLFRLFQILYERLLKMKVLGEQHEENQGKRLNQTALELDLYSNRFEDIDLSKGYYTALLQVTQQFLEGETDQANFEESVRYIYGTDAYIMFTMDKLIQSFIKQIQAVVADKKATEFMALFLKHAGSTYRSLAENIDPDETLYKIIFDQNKQQTTIQILDKRHVLTPQEIYQEYLVNYSDWMHKTKGIDQSLLKPSFLNRNLVLAKERRQSWVVRPQLRYKIQESTYHLYYVVGSEDVYTCRRGQYCETTTRKGSNRWQGMMAINDHLTQSTTEVLI